MRVRVGLEVLLSDPPRWLRGRRVGLLSHQAATTADLRPAHLVLREALGKNLVRLFAPQHGFYGTAQANMIPGEDHRDPLTGVPVVSLYGPRLKPSPEHLADLDLLLVDLVDVGCRVYTYLWTLFLTLEAAEKAGVEVVVLDRPNPLGGWLEGPVLSPDLFSFVGLCEMPLRHGLTPAEAALLFRKRRGLSLTLRVVRAEGWRRDQLFGETGLPWVPPSPNMPSFETALVYPGQVLLEGTNLSEGRGTTRPFELFGAPWLRPERVLSALEEKPPGVVLRPTAFRPAFDKWKDRTCFGFQLHVLDPRIFRPVRTTLLLLRAIARTHEEFAFRPSPYEFEEKKLPIEIIFGHRDIVYFIVGKREWGDLDFWEKGGLTYYANETASLALYEGGFFL
ncbi:exo-beta-N-acetylmuramidase NamZ domain-containing protein [Thermosulfurimonas sp. F29]|uniref:exo-beta-N-acetylmuramidase NamZ family protein n=1 Tax=Thermosulfurimonas sp. F29 TaxID=2867247 RepID=UPI001C83D3D7|nr:DUF1343 domain-containing protein [Thermosulfurimonas sp. F29]MBX6422258.1 DUF1343 domain-containing protein [Thermosulfurimonas sp. F29]